MSYAKDGVASSRRTDAAEEKAIFEAMQVLVEARLARLDDLGLLPVDEDGKGGTNRKGIRKVCSFSTVSSRSVFIHLTLSGPIKSKIYKLNQDPALVGITPGSEEERNILDGLCASAVALKTVAG